MATLLPLFRFAVLSLTAGLLSTSCASTPTASPPPTPATSSARTPDARTPEFVLVGAGDVLVHPQVWEQAERDGGFAPMFAGVRTVISGADLAICHLETPV